MGKNGDSSQLMMGPSMAKLLNEFRVWMTLAPIHGAYHWDTWITPIFKCDFSSHGGTPKDCWFITKKIINGWSVGPLFWETTHYIVVTFGTLKPLVKSPIGQLVVDDLPCGKQNSSSNGQNWTSRSTMIYHDCSIIQTNRCAAHDHPSSFPPRMQFKAASRRGCSSRRAAQERWASRSWIGCGVITSPESGFQASVVGRDSPHGSSPSLPVWVFLQQGDPENAWFIRI